MIAPAALALIFGLMACELGLSRRNEGRLRASGAIEPPGDVYPWLRIVYPAAFLAMGVEGLNQRDGQLVAGAGVIVFAASKALKAWAIASLGPCWSFRVLVLPRRPLVASGPYRYFRHPNYVAIAGEVIGTALVMRAPITGLASLAAVVILLQRRIAVEERALGLRA